MFSKLITAAGHLDHGIVLFARKFYAAHTGFMTLYFTAYVLRVNNA